MKVGGGYVAKKRENPSLKPGYFAAGSSVKSIHAVFGMRAQLKAQDMAYLPRALLARASARTESNGKIARGPSISAVACSDPTVKIQNVTYEGTAGRPAIVTAEHKVTEDIWTRLRENGK